MKSSTALIDSSLVITESLVQAGADLFIGYPITPANLLYSYGSRRFPLFLSAPDEITTLQWMTGFAATGKLPVTATSFPGYALMLESINMAYMMELPMVIILVQRLGPATGTATCGAQGDIALLNGMISGGFAIPVMSISDSQDCWEVPAKALQMATTLRTPVILFTSKEEVMTSYSYDISQFTGISPVVRNGYSENKPYKSYQADENLIPAFLPVGNPRHQVRFTASTHDEEGNLQGTSKAGLENSIRIHRKIMQNMASYTYYELDEQKEADTLIVSFGITSRSAHEAVARLRKGGRAISHLVAKTLLPVPPVYYEIASAYKRVIFCEENYTGQYRQIMYGYSSPDNITGVNGFGKMIDPSEIIREVLKDE
ncbi:MAG: hypothetical protein IH596_02705 [Bacteroidales bacterium]|nr:hypothetical protein [Bacteroidales bacterium]